MSEWRREFVQNAYKADFPIHRAYYDLTDQEKDILWNGDTTWAYTASTTSLICSKRICTRFSIA